MLGGEENYLAIIIAFADVAILGFFYNREKCSKYLLMERQRRKPNMISNRGGLGPGPLKSTKATVIIVARPNQLGLSLQRLLRTVPAIEVLYQVADVATLLENSLTLSPSLLLLDLTTPDAALLAQLSHLKMRWPQARLLALTEGETQSQQVVAAGIDVVLPAGILAARLWEIVATVLAENSDGQNQPNEEQLDVE